MSQSDIQDIVYLITTYETVKNNNSDFIFTDGHGYHVAKSIISTKLAANNIMQYSRETKLLLLR